MDGGKEKAPCTCWEGHSSPYSSQSLPLQSRLSELDQQIRAMLSVLMHQEEGNSFTQTAEFYYKKRSELLNIVRDFQKLYHSLQEHFSDQLPVGSSFSSIPEELHANDLHGMDKVAKLGSPGSNPESVVEDPDIEFHNKCDKELINVCGSVKIEEFAGEKNGFVFTGQMLDISQTLHSLEHRISCSDEMVKLMEDNDRHLKELARRNEEKREANRELSGWIEKLTKENHMLLEQHNKLMDENGALYAKLQELMHDNPAPNNCPKCSRVMKRNTSQLSRLKALFLGW